MLNNAQIYIPSTQGLVEVNSLSELNDPQLHSFASINSSAQLAGISQQYGDFVHNGTGFIQHCFTSDGFRLDLAADIQAGSSWQLAAFIAHVLFRQYQSSFTPEIHKNNKLLKFAEFDSDVKLIVSGEINTANHTASRIDHLAKKTALAQTQIKQWLIEEKTVVFIIPFQNYREPLPDSPIEFIGVQHLNELHAILKSLKLIDSSIDWQSLNLVGSLEQELQGEIIEAKQNEALKEPQAVTIDAIEREPNNNQVSVLYWMKKPSVLITSGIWLVVMFILFFTGIAQKESLAPFHRALSPMEFSYSAVLSKNAASCHLAKELAQQDSNSPHVSFLNGGDEEGLSRLSNFLQFPPNILADICAMQLHTSSLVEAVWLVNKQQVVSINPVVQGNQNRQWSIPIQALSTQNTNTQAGSHYHLLIFIKQTDAADYQSFTHFVNQSEPLQANNAAIEFANWANAMELPVFIVDHLVK